MCIFCLWGGGGRVVWPQVIEERAKFERLSVWTQGRSSVKARLKSTGHRAVICMGIPPVPHTLEWNGGTGVWDGVAGVHVAWERSMKPGDREVDAHLFMCVFLMVVAD